MGTDICIFAERKQSAGRWELFDPPVEKTLWDGETTVKTPNYFFDGRNYALFSILANVRNGSKTEEPFIPIADLRGVPNDMSPIAESIFDQENCESPTWYFVEELFEFDWNQTIQYAAYVDEPYAHLFEDNPLGYPFEQMKKLQNPNVRPGEATITSISSSYNSEGVKVRWRQTYRECARHFLPAIERFRNNEPKTVRLVMWFGS